MAMTDTETPEAKAARFEEIRLEGREHARRALARAQLAQQDVIDGQARLRAVDVQQDDDVRRHAEATAPIQSELAKLDAARVQRVIGKEPVDAKAEARRLDLLRQLDELNRVLALSVSAADEQREKIKAEVVEAQARIGAIDAIVNRLAVNLATVEQQDHGYCLSRKLEYARARMEFAAKKAAEADSYERAARRDGNSEALAATAKRRRQYRAEAAASAADFAAVQDEIERHRQACIDS
jgi:hypothetical protein